VPLCRKKAELRDSHFISQAAYKRVRGQGKNQQRFATNGENTFFRYCYQEAQKFRLLEMLQGLSPLLDNDRWAVYALPVAELRRPPAGRLTRS
jgi:hypothetical protein